MAQLMRAAAAALVTALSGWAQGAAPAVEAPSTGGTTQVAAGRTQEKLSTHPDDWTDFAFEAQRDFGGRHVVIGRVIESERFSLRDTTVALGGYLPLGEATTLQAELAMSDTHRVMPRESLQLQLTRSLGDGWGIIGGLKEVRYDVARIRSAELGIERYFSSLRAAASWYPSHSSVAGQASTHRLQLGHYYGADSHVQAMLVRGTEVSEPTAAGLVPASAVRSAGVYGRHWWSKRFAFEYSLARTRLGDSARDGFGAGVRMRF